MPHPRPIGVKREIRRVGGGVARQASRRRPRKFAVRRDSTRAPPVRRRRLPAPARNVRGTRTVARLATHVLQGRKFTAGPAASVAHPRDVARQTIGVARCLCGTKGVTRVRMCTRSPSLGRSGVATHASFGTHERPVYLHRARASPRDKGRLKGLNPRRTPNHPDQHRQASPQHYSP